MRVNIARWGNGLGLRIPKDVADRAGLHAGSKVEIAAENGRIVIVPARRRYVLTDLLDDMTPQAFDRGPDRGREIVE